jgi:hypothetical protein
MPANGSCIQYFSAALPARNPCMQGTVPHVQDLSAGMSAIESCIAGTYSCSHAGVPVMSRAKKYICFPFTQMQCFRKIIYYRISCLIIRAYPCIDNSILQNRNCHCRSAGATINGFAFMSLWLFKGSTTDKMS